ncbi:hypothetical protein AC629_20685 [Bradyrhizobium sp. NAS80.1]|nr:hypothetical protein AC629_20685 [Bradyrhizobium sp. NAS80.1]
MVLKAENDRLVVLDVPKKAVPVGTVAGLQLAAALKSAEPGLASQVASCACVAVGPRHTPASSAAAVLVRASAVLDSRLRTIAAKADVEKGKRNGP